MAAEIARHKLACLSVFVPTAPNIWQGGHKSEAPLERPRDKSREERDSKRSRGRDDDHRRKEDDHRRSLEHLSGDKDIQKSFIGKRV